MSDDVFVRIRINRHFLGRFAFALVKYGRVAFERMRHEALEDLEQFGNAGAGHRRHETDRYEVALAQRFLERVQLFALAESLGGVESLIEHPAIMTHATIPEDARAALGSGNGCPGAGRAAADDHNFNREFRFYQ